MLYNEDRALEGGHTLDVLDGNQRLQITTSMTHLCQNCKLFFT